MEQRQLNRGGWPWTLFIFGVILIASGTPARTQAASRSRAAYSIRRPGVPAYDCWSEAPHEVASYGIAAVFSEPVGRAGTVDPALNHLTGMGA